MSVALTQVGLDTAAILIDREMRGVSLSDAGAELDECQRLATNLSVEELEAIHQRVRAARAAQKKERGGA